MWKIVYWEAQSFPFFSQPICNEKETYKNVYYFEFMLKEWRDECNKINVLTMCVHIVTYSLVTSTGWTKWPKSSYVQQWIRV